MHEFDSVQHPRYSVLDDIVAKEEEAAVPPLPPEEDAIRRQRVVSELMPQLAAILVTAKQQSKERGAKVAEALFQTFDRFVVGWVNDPAELQRFVKEVFDEKRCKLRPHRAASYLKKKYGLKISNHYFLRTWDLLVKLANTQPTALVADPNAELVNSSRRREEELGLGPPRVGGLCPPSNSRRSGLQGSSGPMDRQEILAALRIALEELYDVIHVQIPTENS